jgi:hypothetical protein
MEAKTSLADFEALVRRSGVPLSPTQISEIYAGWPWVEVMLDRVRGYGRDRAAEPALTFDPAAFGTETK